MAAFPAESAAIDPPQRDSPPLDLAVFTRSGDTEAEDNLISRCDCLFLVEELECGLFRTPPLPSLGWLAACRGGRISIASGSFLWKGAARLGRRRRSD